ncbi:MAG TPA: LuxR C-terminal-related transcriptional regulator [Kofleriaceae bacterium]|nr:LuxR C-terminal-related transcriptional regulator [Kofleriaceae bacterium]
MLSATTTLTQRERLSCAKSRAMGRRALDSRDRQRVREIVDELAVVRLDEPRSVISLFPAIRDVVELDTLGLYSVRNRTGRWQLDWCEVKGELGIITSLLPRLFTRSATFPLFYNPTAAPREQRNRVIDAYEWITTNMPGEWDGHPMCTDVLRPLGAQQYRQPRALLCDGSTVIAWFGGVHSSEPTGRQVQLLGAFVEPLRRRLVAESRLRESAYATAALEVALERLGSATFVVDARGAVRHANRAGRALIDRDPATLKAALRQAAAGRPSGLPVELVPIDDGGDARLWLASVTETSADARIAAAVAACRARWRLTPKQVEVLRYVVEGRSNTTIAGLLGCVERTVELHVTALLDKAGVDSRAGLVARVLTIV